MSLTWNTVTNAINIGSSPNKGDGDSLRLAFTKINANFREVFDAVGSAAITSFDLIDGANNHVADIQAYTGSFNLPITGTNAVSLFTFSTGTYRSASIDIVANNQTTGAVEYANGYTVNWNGTYTNVIGFSPVSVASDGGVSTAQWEIKDATVNGGNVTVNLYNVQGVSQTSDQYNWKAKVTLFRV